jgi:hypothetical protein
LDKYANRSGYLKKISGKPTEPKAYRKSYENLKSKFRPQKKNSNIFVEKTKFAIDSYEEKFNIPYKAARLKRSGYKRRK